MMKQLLSAVPKAPESAAISAIVPSAKMECPCRLKLAIHKPICPELDICVCPNVEKLGIIIYWYHYREPLLGPIVMLHYRIFRPQRFLFFFSYLTYLTNVLIIPAHRDFWAH